MRVESVCEGVSVRWAESVGERGSRGGNAEDVRQLDQNSFFISRAQFFFPTNGFLLKKRIKVSKIGRAAKDSRTRPSMSTSTLTLTK